MDIRLKELRKDFFKELYKLIAEGNISKDYEEAYGLLNDTEPPIEWFIKEVSELNGKEYYYMPIEFAEDLMREIFGWYEDIKIDTQIQNYNGVYAVTTNLTIGFSFGNGDFQKQKCGTSTVVIKDTEITYQGNTKTVMAIEQLTLATPLSLVKARVNAIKNIASVFGKNVNRSMEIESENKIMQTLNFLNSK